MVLVPSSRTSLFVFCGVLLLTLCLMLSVSAQTAGLEPIWPNPGYDRQNSYRCPYNGPAVAPTIQWQYDTGFNVGYDVAIGADGTIYLGGPSGKFRALTPDGVVKWEVTLDPTALSYNIARSSVIGPDGTIYTSVTKTVYALNPNGSSKWSYAGETVTGISIADDGTIYCGMTGKVVALDSTGALKRTFTFPTVPNATYKYHNFRVAPNGDLVVRIDGVLASVKADGTLCWIWTEPKTSTYQHDPVVDKDGTIYFSTTNGVYAIAGNGQTKWNVNTSSLFLVPYLTIGYNDIIYLYQGGKKTLLALNKDGSEAWRKSMNWYPDTTIMPVAADGTLYTRAPIFSAENPNLVKYCAVLALNPDGTIKWEVKATNFVAFSIHLTPDGSLYCTSTALTKLSTNQAQLPTPLLQAPVTNAVDVATPVTLQWSAVATATAYKIQIAQDANFTVAVDTSVVQAPAITKSAALQQNTKFYWRVKAMKGLIEGLYSAANCFTTASAPIQAPVLVSPADNITGLTTPVTLTWGMVAGVTGYKVELCKSAYFATGVTTYTVTGADQTTKQVTVDYSSRHYWRVRALAGTGEGPASPVRSFVTAVRVPLAPVLICPVNNAVAVDTVAKFSWTKPQYATCYWVQVSTSPTFATTLISNGNVPENMLTSIPLPKNTKLYWHVRARNDLAIGPWSPTGCFTTAAPILPVPPKTPAPLAPDNDAYGVVRPVTLRWSVTAATAYAVQVSKNAEFTQLLINTAAVRNTYLTLTTLTPGTRYWWRVQAMNNYGKSAWCAGQRFTTEQGTNTVDVPKTPTTLATDVTVAEGPLAIVTFSWQPVGSATGYWIQLAEDAAFTKLSTNSDGCKLPIFTTTLPLGTVRYWRVRAWNAAGISAWTTPQVCDTTL